MSDITVSPTSGCDAIVTWTPPAVSDNCSVATFVPDISPGSTFAAGKTTVTYTATDASGNSATETFEITVTDATPPVISCLSDISVTTNTSCGLNVSWVPPTVTDCSTFVLNSNYSPGDFFETGTTAITYTATDAAGNISSCSFNVIVTDLTPPVFSNCPIQIDAVANSCEVEVSWSPPLATDNCGTITINSSHTPGEMFPIGETKVTYTAVDLQGNTSTCSFDVVVTDGNPPSISNCPSNMTVLVGSLESTEVKWTAPTASVGCGTVTLNSTHNSGDVFSLGSTPVSYVATDDSGRTFECSFNVDVVYAQIEFTIADLITPNGDGKNDFWELQDLERFIDNSVTIVDRWGGVVFSARGYDNDKVVWSGQNKVGGLVPTGTYFYTISVRLGNSKVERDGFIELIR
jgi:gliding motility-associated-like protein